MNGSRKIAAPATTALIEKGAAPGTTLASVMSAVAVSFPKMVILRKA
ncbi:MAG: hypothetical protein P4L43_01675 [Syntrophobacteraceae bacterium]|nr:hypothetical protein [Syntrophobacteraceae bacterium]